LRGKLRADKGASVGASRYAEVSPDCLGPLEHRPNAHSSATTGQRINPFSIVLNLDHKYGIKVTHYALGTELCSGRENPLGEGDAKRRNLGLVDSETQCSLCHGDTLARPSAEQFLHVVHALSSDLS
jgi:hypothetical protein